MATDNRSRNFATVIYPDSAPENWIQLADELHIPAFISPLHDSDFNPTGEAKKPHHHVMLMFEGKKSPDQVRELFESFGGVGCERVNSLRSYARYLCHLDNPDKAQYNVENVIALCGSDYFELIGLPSDKYVSVGEIMDFCVKYEFYSFSELAMYCKANRYDWYRVLVDKSTIYMREFLKSLKWDKYDKDVRHRVDCDGNLIDVKTGEIVTLEDLEYHE